ncbi:single-stranded-DNA-specific exonuclease RecJ [Candidatus Dependentiae bacterium]|nr:single-stranded-DNA-specific exonuclease RecJ [Candidatus Dependentiae bacterium]
MIGSKYLWKLPEHSSQAVLHLAASYNLSLPIMQTLASRGLTTKEDLDRYLFSTFERDVAHPTLLKDAEKAIARILRAIKDKEKILICGDYDVDGITSSAMIMTCLLPLGADVNFFLPNRVKDGYGLSAKTVTRAAQNKYTVLITVDNGITAFEAGLEAQRLGIDLIITDHHKPHDHVPESYAIINPHQDTCPYPYKKLAGVGVTFKLMSLLYEQLGRKLSDKIYELMLLGTVADVVPLTGENRFWVRHGLTLINKEESLAFRVLKQNMRSSKTLLSSTDIGFSIAPQLNALGRLEDARQGVFFLIGTDEEKVAHIGTVLRELNEARKSIEKSIFTDVDNEVKSRKIDISKERLILATSSQWQPGVIGLVASRLVHAYNRPTILLSIDRHSQAKGSCRSVPGVNMFDLLQEQKHLLSSFGGHAQAAGLSLPFERVPALKERLEESLAQKLPTIEPKAHLILDAEITLQEVNKKLIEDLAHLEPFGNENPPPVFYLKGVTLLEQPQLLKDAHVKCLLFSEGVIKPIIFFNRPELYTLLSSRLNDKISLAVQATENHFNGKVSIELQGLDVAL